MTRQGLWELESYLRHFAMVELPKIERTTEEALAISASLEEARKAGNESATRQSVARATINATKAIDGALVGVAATYLDTYQHELWDECQTVYCDTIRIDGS